MWNVNTWYHRTLGTIGGAYTKETVQYTDSIETKTMSHSILCRFISAFLKIYWQISMCNFFSKRDSWKPPTYQTKLTSLEKNVTYCDDVLRNVRKKKTQINDRIVNYEKEKYEININSFHVYSCYDSICKEIFAVRLSKNKCKSTVHSQFL